MKMKPVIVYQSGTLSLSGDSAPSHLPGEPSVPVGVDARLAQQS